MEIECRTISDSSVPDVFDVYKTTVPIETTTMEEPIEETTESPYGTTTNQPGSLKILYTLCVHSS